MRIVVLGDLNLDVMAHAPAELEPGAETRDVVRAAPGGSGGTFARVAAAHGASVAFLGCTGADAIGDLLIRSLEEAGVESHVQRDGRRPSGVILALHRGGERSMVCSRGANDGIRADCIEEATFDGADHLHLSGYALLSLAQHAAVERSVALARDRGFSISVDPPPASLIRGVGVDAFRSRLPESAWLFPNRTEGELLSGASEPSAIVERLATRAGVGALTLGGEGSLAWEEAMRHDIASEPFEDIDTTGAGDAFAGAFVASYLARRDLAAAHRVAANAARAHLSIDRAVPP